MFWERYENLCALKGMKPNSEKARTEIGVSPGIITKWKNGALPNGENLLKLSSYFGCSVDYLLGLDNKPNAKVVKMPNIFSTQIEDEIVNTKYCSYREFVSYFSPDGALADSLDSFIFRGESSTKYDLIPTALRPNSVQNIKYKDFFCGLEKSDWIREYSQVWFEYTMLFRFYQSANKSGLKLPYVRSLEKKHLPEKYNDAFINQLINDTFGKWISEDFEELAALAQHYGVPTRLLDWSFDYKVAMYFAASGACRHQLKKIETNDYMVIWAIDKSEADKIPDIPLKFVVPNYYRNPNLNAQKGILSHWESRTLSSIINMKKRNLSSLSQLLVKYSRDSEFDIDVSKILYKFKIPISECAEMFDYLYNSGYNAAHIFPGYDGVVKTLKEKTMINELSEIVPPVRVPVAARDTDNATPTKPNLDDLDDLPTMDEE